MKYFCSLLLLVVAQVCLGQTPPPPVYLGEDWRPRLPANSSENLNAIAVHSTTNIVAVGDHGTVQMATKLATSGLVRSGTSPFGDWAKGTVTPAITSDLLDVIWVEAQLQYVAVGKQGTVLTSGDGITWASKTVGGATTQWNAVAATTGDHLVIVGNAATGAGVVQISADKGATWTSKAITGAVGLKDVVSAGGGNVLAVGLNKLFISGDHGATWTSMPLTATTPTSIAFVSGKAVIIGTKSWQYTPSTQALVALTVPTTDLVLNTVDTELVGTNNRGEVWSSVDAGKTWQSRLIAQHIQFNAASRYIGDYIVVGDGGVIENSSTRVDGDWLQKQALSLNLTKDLTSVTTNKTSSAVAVGKGGTVVTATSYNTWAAATVVPALGVDVDLSKVIWTGTEYVAVGSAGTVLKSADGASWTSKSISGEKLTGVAWNGSQYLAVGVSASGTGVMWSSGDGVQWTSVTPTIHLGQGFIAVPPLVDVAWAKTAFVVAAKGYALYSTDGSTWTARALPGALPVKITPDGTITGSQRYRAQGTLWAQGAFPSPLPASTLVDQVDVTPAGQTATDPSAASHQVGLTAAGAIYSSADGGNQWQIQCADQHVALACAVKFDNHIVVVGAGGLIETYSENGTDATKWLGLASVTNSVAWNKKAGADARYVAVGWDMSWTGVPEPAPALGQAIPGNIVWTPHRQGTTTELFSGVQVVWSGKQFVAVGGRVWTSTDDGATWSPKLDGPGADPSVNTITNTGAKLIAFAYDHTRKQLFEAISTDQGDSWTGFVPITGNLGVINQPGYQWEMLGVAKATGDFYFAVGWAGHYLISGTGAPNEWVEGIHKLAYTQEDFSTLIWSVDVGRYIMGTTYGGFWNFDGSTFTKGTVWKIDPVTQDWKKTYDGQGSHAIWSIKRVGAEFIAVGNRGFIWKSYNGIDWREYEPYKAHEPGTYPDPGGDANLRDVRVAGGSQSPNYLFDLVAGDNCVVLAGGLGTFISSDGTAVPPQPKITFTPNQASFTENVAVGATFTVTVSKVLFPGPITIPIIISPSNKRFKTNVSSVTLTRTQLSRTFTIAGIDTVPIEADTPLKATPSPTAPGDFIQTLANFDAAKAADIQPGWIVLKDKKPTNDVSFEADSSTITEGSAPSVDITVKLQTPNNNDAITVPLIFATTSEHPVPTTAYIRPAGNKVVIPKGSTSAKFTVTMIDNNVADPTRTIYVLLDQPAANASLSSEHFTNGQSKTLHTITVIDDDAKPQFAVDADQPTGQLAAVGSTATFTAKVTAKKKNGDAVPYKAQWLRNGVAIAGKPVTSYSGDQTITLSLTNVALANAGSYQLLVTSAAGNVTSNSVPLAVVDQTPTKISFKLGTSLTLTTAGKVAGSGMTYQWMHGGGPLGGETRSTLILSNVLTEDDTFACKIIMGTQNVTTGDFILKGASQVPELTSTTLGTTEIGATYDFTPVTTQPTSSWTITGLPIGLKFDSSTGRITGSPAQSGSFTVNLTPRNSVGTGSLKKLPLVVGKLPDGFAGRFVGIIAADATVNQNLGGRIDITVTSTGALSGKLFDAPATGVRDEGHFTSFSGNLGGMTGNVRTATVTLGSGATAKVINVSALEATAGKMTGTVSINTSSAPLTGWRQTSATTANSGYYTVSLAPADTTKGYGYTTFTIAADGSVTGFVRTANNAQVKTFAACSGPGGQIDIFGLQLYTGVIYGSVLGELTVVNGSSAPTNNKVTGSLGWTAPAVASVPLAADGGRYFVPSAGQMIMNLPLPVTAGNLAATFAGADLNDMTNSPNVNFSVSTTAVATPPSTNPASTSLLFLPSTGEFNGRFIDNPSTAGNVVLYYGVLIRPAGTDAMVGRGGFSTTSAMGSVTLQKAP